MATNITFTSLVADVQGYLERGNAVADPTVFAQIPRLINAAERKLAQTLKLQGQIEVLNDPVGLVAGVSVISKPDRWRQTVSLSFGGGANSNVRTPLFPRSLDYCRMFWPDDSIRDVPAFYGDYDISHWLIVPTPAFTYPLELLAYMLPELLDASNQTNFWSELCGTALLYGTLLEATPYIKGDDRLPMWQNLWSTELATLDQQDLGKILDRAAERTKP